MNPIETIKFAFEPLLYLCGSCGVIGVVVVGGSMLREHFFVRRVRGIQKRHNISERQALDAVDDMKANHVTEQQAVLRTKLN